MLNKLVRSLSTYKGQLYTWGSNKVSLGYEVSSTSMSISRPQKVSDFEPGTVKSISMSNNHTAVVDQEGHVYTFGRGDYGMLGHDSEQKVLQPKMIENLAKIDMKMTEVATGEFHTVLLSEEGDVWTMGYGGELTGGFWRQMFSQGGGGLGHGDKENKFVPTPIERLKEHDDIVKITAGAYHSMALGGTGRIYVWGKGEYGTLGIGKNINYLSPVPNPFFDDILENDSLKAVDMKSCSYYSSVVLEDGRAFGWGRNDDGQLGIGTSIGVDMYESEKWPAQAGEELETSKVKEIQTGENICAYLTEDNEVYIAGLRLWWHPKKLNKPEQGEVTSVFAGSRFAGYVIDQKDVYFIGNMFSGKDAEEIVDLRIWKVKPEVFGDKKIEKIGGSYKNNYCFLID